jgi:hypothetical protein
VSTRSSFAGCVDPVQAELATPYCFGEATAAQRDAFELHLLECDACWREVQRLDDAVRVLRADLSLAHALTVREMSGLFGMSASLDQPFGGHRRHALVASAMYALLYAVPVFVEIGSWWDRLGRWGAIGFPLVFLWMWITTAVALEVGVRAVRQGRGGFWRALPIMLAGTAVVSAAVVPGLPPVPTVYATFQTYPANLAYLKSVFYAWWVGPVFMLWPLYVVTMLQRQLAAGHYRGVLSLLTGDHRALPPRDVRYPPVWALMVYLAALFVFNWIGTSHLFDHLTEAPYRILFMALVMIRGALWLGLPALCIWWYAGCLSEIKRECIAVLSFAEGPSVSESRTTR